ncbi:MBL fold metallo-hydrolase [Marinobacterium arenosum]|uniref:MBL fold metallo-hydrolase n=1 Tax=Marinobacterium arenosum TaxID=2862496 RepID=UPI001C954238|nr:MBL fold metallo-hydrolase [Marinobacterium arenosum]MBY4679129.1 MBL fold metallo-hydrolase [Marinobacterium arenosum]
MKKFSAKKVLLAAALLSLTANAQAAEFIYKPASMTEIAVNLQKVEGGHLERFKKPYEIQRLSDNIYWVSAANYNVTVLVGKEGVLLIDAPMHTGKQILKAIKAITDKPLRGIVYSHAHADHVGDSSLILKELGDENIDIYATEEVSDALLSHGVTLPAPVTKIIGEQLVFEGHTFEVYKDLDGHTPDNTGFLIEDGGRKVLHAIDLVHPDQLEFRSFSNVENAIAYKNDIDKLLKMDWDVMVTGHSNLGYKEDVEFVQQYIRDIQNYIHQGHANADFSAHLKSDTPFAWYAGYSDEVIDFATDLLAKKYREGREEEFDIVARSHVKVMFWAMLARAL